MSASPLIMVAMESGASSISTDLNLGAPVSCISCMLRCSLAVGTDMLPSSLDATVASTFQSFAKVSTQSEPQITYQSLPDEPGILEASVALSCTRLMIPTSIRQTHSVYHTLAFHAVGFAIASDPS
jgi:hypothetical protein